MIIVGVDTVRVGDRIVVGSNTSLIVRVAEVVQTDAGVRFVLEEPAQRKSIQFLRVAAVTVGLISREQPTPMSRPYGRLDDRTKTAREAAIKTFWETIRTHFPEIEERKLRGEDAPFACAGEAIELWLHENGI